MAFQRLYLLGGCAVVLLTLGMIKETEGAPGRYDDRDRDRDGDRDRYRDRFWYANRHTDADHHPQGDHPHYVHHMRASDSDDEPALPPKPAEGADDDDPPPKPRPEGRGRAVSGKKSEDEDMTLVDRAAKNNAPKGGQDAAKGAQGASQNLAPAAVQAPASKVPVASETVGGKNGEKDVTNVQGVLAKDK